MHKTGEVVVQGILTTVVQQGVLHSNRLGVVHFEQGTQRSQNFDRELMLEGFCELVERLRGHILPILDDP